MQKQIQTDR